MLFTHPKEQEFHRQLLEGDVFTMRQWNNWETPEEGELYPLLAKYYPEFKEDAYVDVAIQTNPILLRVNGLEADPAYWKQFGIGKMNQLVKEHSVIPLQMAGYTHWFGVGIFHPFDPEPVHKLTELKSGAIAWNILTPPEFMRLREQYARYSERM